MARKKDGGLFLFCRDQLGLRESLICVNSLCAWKPIIVLLPSISQYVMRGQSGVLLGKEAGSILPFSLLVLIHPSIHPWITARSEPCNAGQSRTQCIMGSGVRWFWFPHLHYEGSNNTCFIGLYKKCYAYKGVCTVPGTYEGSNK